jgi:hypothetical protein
MFSSRLEISLLSCKAVLIRLPYSYINGGRRAEVAFCTVESFDLLNGSIGLPADPSTTKRKI